MQRNNRFLQSKGFREYLAELAGCRQPAYNHQAGMFGREGLRKPSRVA